MDPSPLVVELLLFAAVALFAAGMLVLVVFVVLPVRRLVAQLRDFAGSRPELGPRLNFRNEAELLTQTFRLLTQELKSKEAELERLYRGAEARARFMERTSDRLVEMLPVGVVGLDRTGRVTAVNRSGEALLGVRPGVVDGEPLERLFGEGTALARRVRRVLEGEEGFRDEEFRWEAPGGGGERVLQVSVVPLPSGGPGEEGGAVAALHDLTPLRVLEAEVRTTERLAALGTLSAGLAHEIRNPLGAILSSVGMLRKHLSADPAADELAAVVEEEARLLNRILADFVEFVRDRENAADEEVDWNRVAEQVVERLAHTLRDRKVRVMLGNLPRSRTPGLDRAGAVQILYNLLLNAVEASPAGAAVEVQGGEEEAAEVFLRVKDRGAGIPEEMREKIFNPFHTGKPGGLGLGLSMVHRIVSGARGSLELESRVGKGTTFTVRLPRLPPGIQAGAPSP